jgi:hypothetical protein
LIISLALTYRISTLIIDDVREGETNPLTETKPSNVFALGVGCVCVLPSILMIGVVVVIAFAAIMYAVNFRLRRVRSR